MRKLWRDIGDMNPLESNNKFVTYHSWFACPLLDLQADLCTRVWNGGAPLIPPRYLYLEIPKHVMTHEECEQLPFARTYSRGGILHLAQWKWTGYKCSCTAVQQQHRVPYELRICSKCNWHCVQDEEHVLLNCLSADLANLRAKHHHPFCNPSRSSNRLRDFTSQADTKGLALYVHECI